MTRYLAPDAVNFTVLRFRHPARLWFNVSIVFAATSALNTVAGPNTHISNLVDAEGVDPTPPVSPKYSIVQPTATARSCAPTIHQSSRGERSRSKMETPSPKPRTAMILESANISIPFSA